MANSGLKVPSVTGLRLLRLLRYVCVLFMDWAELADDCFSVEQLSEDVLRPVAPSTGMEWLCGKLVRAGCCAAGENVCINFIFAMVFFGDFRLNIPVLGAPFLLFLRDFCFVLMTIFGDS